MNALGGSTANLVVHLLDKTSNPCDFAFIGGYIGVANADIKGRVWFKWITE